MRRAILLGGAGFIGTHLARHLSAEGYAVTVGDLVDPLEPVDGARYLHLDVRKPLDDVDLEAGPALLVNLAAVHREPGHEPGEYFEANADGARNVAALCERLGATDVVFVSSISVYGVTEDPVAEDRAPAPVTPYGQSKLAAEGTMRGWVEAGPGRTLSIVRPAAVFGPGEGGNLSRLGQALLRGRFVFPGRRDTIKGCGYVEDLVRAIPYMHGRNGTTTIYNFAFPHPLRLDEICASYARVSGCRAPRGTIPFGLMRLAGRLGDAIGPLGRATGLSKRRIEKLVTSTDIRPAALVAAGFEYRYDLDGALAHWLEQPPAGQFV